jgi:quercetin dioxygenase-like cupin family protein
MSTNETDRMIQLAISAMDAATFSSERRHVTRLYRSPQCEVMVVGWEKGQASSAHRHLGSVSTVVVLAGAISVRNGSGAPRLFGIGGLCVTPDSMEHQIENRSDARAVTLHIYCPPLKDDMPQPFLDASI